MDVPDPGGPVQNLVVDTQRSGPHGRSRRLRHPVRKVRTRSSTLFPLTSRRLGKTVGVVDTGFWSRGRERIFQCASLKDRGVFADGFLPKWSLDDDVAVVHVCANIPSAA